MNHVAFLRSALGSAAVPIPQINVGEAPPRWARTPSRLLCSSQEPGLITCAAGLPACCRLSVSGPSSSTGARPPTRGRTAHQLALLGCMPSSRPGHLAAAADTRPGHPAAAVDSVGFLAGTAFAAAANAAAGATLSPPFSPYGAVPAPCAFPSRQHSSCRPAARRRCARRELPLL